MLERLSRRQTCPQRLVRRVGVVLAAADGLNNDQIARREGVTRAVARTWRGRWLVAAPRLEAAGDDDRLVADLVADALADAPRAGAPATFRAEQVVRIVAIACEPPPASARPTSHWTPR